MNTYPLPYKINHYKKYTW